LRGRELFTITYFSGDQRNVDNGELCKYGSLEEMSTHFRKPIKGSKHHAYFVRGACEPMYRKDANIFKSELIVLDGDMGIDKGNAPSPREVHDALRKLGYNHFIYTSHSHMGAEKNKFRCVLRTVVPIEKSQLRATVGSILRELKDKSVGIYPCNEMWRWSQPWFIPSRDDPEDGLFEYYGWFGGVSIPVKEAHEELSVAGENGKIFDFSRDWHGHMRGIIESDMFHPGILSMGWAFAKDGVDESMAVAFIQTLFSACADAEKDSRWHQRYDDINRIVRQGYEKINEVHIDIDNLPDLEEEGYYKSSRVIPWPPGLLGKLTQNAYDMALFRYREVALVSAVGAVVGIIGRKFNVSCPKPLGLNVYLTLIMPTGMGKDSIGEFIKHVYYTVISDVDNRSCSFLGKSRYTSYKAVINDLESARCKVSIFTEAGLLLASKSGDISGFTRALLSLYSCSASTGYSNAEGFSDSENDVPVLRAPSLSIVSEATPETLLSTFRASGAAERGDIARQSIFRISGDKPHISRTFDYFIDTECADKLKYLAHKCSQTQAESDPKVHLMPAESASLQDDIYEFMDHCVNMERKYRDLDGIKSIMWSRAAVKALKYAGICSVFNRSEAIICEEEWQWGKSLVEYEMEGVESFFRGGDFGNILDDIAVTLVAPAIIKILKGKYKDQKCLLPTKDREKGLFPLSGLRCVLKNNKMLNDLNDSASGRGRSMTGFQKVIQYMTDNQLIFKAFDPSAPGDTKYHVNSAGGRLGRPKSIVYGVTSDFWDMIEFR